MNSLGEVLAAEAADGDGAISCARAFVLARRLGVPPAELGAAADAAGVRVVKCQLGLFGYGRKAEGKSKIVRAEEPGGALRGRLTSAVGSDGALTCASAWQIARDLRIGRLRVAGAAQAMGLRIADCQLGCFKPGWSKAAKSVPNASQHPVQGEDHAGTSAK
jgi:hypothetical protein